MDAKVERRLAAATASDTRTAKLWRYYLGRGRATGVLPKEWWDLLG